MSPRMATRSSSVKDNFKLETLEDEIVAVLAAFRSSAPASLPGRHEQIEKVNELLKKCINEKQSSSIYIYGAPGHGKTASVKMITNQTYVKDNMNVVYVDCRKLLTTVDIYEAIARKLNNPTGCKRASKASIKYISGSIGRKKRPTLLILDEMDRLKTHTDSILYSLLELRSTVSSGKIVVIGIGNAQNFIDTLPLVKNNDALEPTLIEFGAYTKEDIKQILVGRLSSVSLERLVFTETAIELLAGKTAVFGDARVSLGLASAIVQNVFDNVDGDDICKVDPFSVMSAFNSAFGADVKNDDGKDAIDSLTLPQKFIICSIVILLKTKLCAVKNLTLMLIYKQYKEISTKKGIEVLSQSEFLYACRMIEQQGFFNRKKSSKKSISWEDRVLLKWDQSELLKMLTNKPMLSDILSIESNANYSIRTKRS